MRFKLLLIGLLVANPVFADWRGNIALESRFFTETGDFGQDKQQYSIKVEPEYFQQGDNSLFTLQVFGREDSLDNERSHVDLRELSWLFYGDDWEFKAGVSKVFWGVAESQHLVDIINQTDAVENVDGEDKLGQPMLNLTLIRDWGNLNFFILPYFRERTYAGFDGRFRAPLRIDDSLTTYASSDEENRIDGAIRWFSTIGDWDIGVAHFSGTSREPRFIPTFTGADELVLAPHYTTIDQTSLDLQATIESWLWKLELISNSGFDLRRYTAAIFGFEYSFYDIKASGIDLGIIAEYQYDDRTFDYAGQPVLDSLVLGSRLAFNDEQSTELLVGVGINEEDNAFWNIEASRRIGQNWKVNLEGRILTGIDENAPQASPFYAVRNDSFIMLELGYYF
jgi:hypothetical protein